MPKHILIFSDGTGQIGGQKPDQRLSNVYKLYNATRPGPFSPIKPSEQVAFYDPGLGAGEVDGITFRKIRNMLEAAVGTGIDENVVDCYEKIISYYEPGDKVLLFGFSRGAYTVRSVANVMNLCGIPTKMPDGSPVPKFGPVLRKIASDAVKYVYNHGAGIRRVEEPYFKQREEKARRFRIKYGSAPTEGENVQGNVQPHFIGVFDTVAALGNMAVTWLIRGVSLLVVALLAFSMVFAWHWLFTSLVAGLLAVIFYWYVNILKSQFKYFSEDENNPLRFSRITDWPKIWKNGHRAVWNRTHYDKWLDSEVQFARHAMAIDEQRADFPRVGWALAAEAQKTAGRKPEWLKQVWFSGCHSDIGGSYPEPESRLSDIALDWMICELKECVPDIRIREDVIVRAPDPLGLQHEETFIFEYGPLRKKWKVGPRAVEDIFRLHPSVLVRLKAGSVPQNDKLGPYRPPQLKNHPSAKDYFPIT